jgi:NADP-dependent 3-hydroxy acid dehydrogenase YdfG
MVGTIESDAAIVTGASSGIGREGVDVTLAREGIDVALAARREERLEELADRVESETDAEEDAIATYRELIDTAGAADDPVTEDLAVPILSDGEVHRTEFRGFRTEYRD